MQHVHVHMLPQTPTPAAPSHDAQVMLCCCFQLLILYEILSHHHPTAGGRESGIRYMHVVPMLPHTAYFRAE